MKQTMSVTSRSRTELIDITDQVHEMVKKSGLKDGICHLFVPHTTAGITINEGADPSVKRDILTSLNRLVPFDGDYQHAEGNSAAHIKTTMVGTSAVCLIEDSQLVLGTWQSIFFCEFDGPRTRRVYISTI